MSEAEHVAVIASIAPTVAALCALGMGFINSRKVDKVHVLVNSNLAQVKSDLAEALEIVRRQQHQIDTTES